MKHKQCILGQFDPSFTITIERLRRLVVQIAVAKHTLTNSHNLRKQPTTKNKRHKQKRRSKHKRMNMKICFVYTRENRTDSIFRYQNPPNLNPIECNNLKITSQRQ